MSASPPTTLAYLHCNCSIYHHHSPPHIVPNNHRLFLIDPNHIHPPNIWFTLHPPTPHQSWLTLPIPTIHLSTSLAQICFDHSQQPSGITYLDTNKSQPHPSPIILPHSFKTQFIKLHAMSHITVKLLCKPSATLHYRTTNPPFTISEAAPEAFAYPLQTTP